MNIESLLVQALNQTNGNSQLSDVRLNINKALNELYAVEKTQKRRLNRAKEEKRLQEEKDKKDQFIIAKNFPKDALKQLEQMIEEQKNKLKKPTPTTLMSD